MSPKKMLPNKCSAAFVILMLTFVGVGFVNADWEILLQIGREVSSKFQHRYRLAEKIITVPTNSTTVRHFATTAVADPLMPVKLIYVFRAEHNPTTKLGKDYHIGIVGGGIGKTYATLAVTTLPNPNNEEMKFAIQLIGFASS